MDSLGSCAFFLVLWMVTKIWSKYMVATVKRLLLICGCLWLFGCTTNMPARLGISDLEWASYSQEKQQSLITNYGRVAKERTSISKQNVGDSASVVVSIYDGKIMFPPAFIDWQHYKAVQFTISEGQCIDVELEHKLTSKINTKLGACFHNSTLYLDPSRYNIAQKYGSINIHSSPLWKTGFVYKGINSNGYVRFNNVTVAIKQ